MCFYPNENSKVLVAKSNITVYKVVKSYGGSDTCEVYAPYKHTTYSLGKTYKTRYFVTDDQSCSRKFISRLPRHAYNHGIGAGFHSFTNRYLAIRELVYMTNDRSNLVVVKCRIPKGTPYMRNKSGEVVSLALKIVGFI
jgi:hypothetical protein